MAFFHRDYDRGYRQTFRAGGDYDRQRWGRGEEGRGMWDRVKDAARDMFEGDERDERYRGGARGYGWGAQGERGRYGRDYERPHDPYGGNARAYGGYAGNNPERTRRGSWYGRDYGGYSQGRERNRGYERDYYSNAMGYEPNDFGSRVGNRGERENRYDRDFRNRRW